jgi:hypothetical protein
VTNSTTQMDDTTKLKWVRRGSITLGILLILAALNYFPWEVFFHKFGAMGLAHEEFVEKRAGFSESLLAELPVDNQVPEVIMRELKPMQMSDHDLRQLAVVRSLTMRDSRAAIYGTFYYTLQAVMWGFAFFVGVKLIRYWRKPSKPSASEQTPTDISTLIARVEELERRLNR